VSRGRELLIGALHADTEPQKNLRRRGHQLPGRRDVWPPPLAEAALAIAKQQIRLRVATDLRYGPFLLFLDIALSGIGVCQVLGRFWRAVCCPRT